MDGGGASSAGWKDRIRLIEGLPAAWGELLEGVVGEAAKQMRWHQMELLYLDGRWCWR